MIPYDAPGGRFVLCLVALMVACDRTEKDAVVRDSADRDSTDGLDTDDEVEGGQGRVIFDFLVPGIGMWAVSEDVVEWWDVTYDGTPTEVSGTIIFDAGQWYLVGLSGGDGCKRSEDFALEAGGSYRWVVDAFPGTYTFEEGVPDCQE